LHALFGDSYAQNCRAITESVHDNRMVALNDRQIACRPRPGVQSGCLKCRQGSLTSKLIGSVNVFVAITRSSMPLPVKQKLFSKKECISDGAISHFIRTGGFRSTLLFRVFFFTLSNNRYLKQSNTVCIAVGYSGQPAPTYNRYQKVGRK
jgi:hypothetical protein